ncbi:MAG: ribonuclease H-like YkuK family protein [Flavobacteriaceae bacterium]
MLLFKDISGKRIDTLAHTLNILKKNPSVEIHVGSDSQSVGKQTIYCTVIAYRFGNRGVHYVLSKTAVPLINDMWTRLWKEAELSIEVAEWISKLVPLKIEIDMDYNEDENFQSYKLISAAKGWANSLGYKVNVKPHNQIATRAADHHCK